MSTRIPLGELSRYAQWLATYIHLVEDVGPDFIACFHVDGLLCLYHDGISFGPYPVDWRIHKDWCFYCTVDFTDGSIKKLYALMNFINLLIIKPTIYLPRDFCRHVSRRKTIINIAAKNSMYLSPSLILASYNVGKLDCKGSRDSWKFMWYKVV